MHLLKISYYAKALCIILATLLLLFFSTNKIFSANYDQINIEAKQYTINLSWKKNQNYSYSIEYRNIYAGADSFSSIPVFDDGITVSAVIQHLSPNTSYNIRITSKDLSGVTYQPQLLLVTTLSEANNPSIYLNGSSTSEGITLNWTDSLQRPYFVEYRVHNNNSTFLPFSQDPIYIQNFFLKDGASGEVYDIRIAGLDKALNQITASNILTLPDGLNPQSPYSFTLSSTKDLVIEAMWNITPNQYLNGNKIVSYSVQYKKDTSNTWNTLSIPANGLVNSISIPVVSYGKYNLRVASVGLNGQSNYIQKDIFLSKSELSQNQNIPTNTANPIILNINASSDNSLLPGTPGAVNVESTKKGSIDVSWLPGLSGTSPIKSYTILYKQQADPTWETVIFDSTKNNFYTLENLIPGRVYQLKIAANNSHGVGKYSDTYTTKVTEENKKTCKQLLTTYIQYNDKNNNISQVRLLQSFLKKVEKNSKIKITGIYGPTTFEEVKSFQQKYKKDVLSPWKLTKPTGWVYITTQKKINDLYCLYVRDGGLEIQ